MIAATNFKCCLRMMLLNPDTVVYYEARDILAVHEQDIIQSINKLYTGFQLKLNYYLLSYDTLKNIKTIK